MKQVSMTSKLLRAIDKEETILLTITFIQRFVSVKLEAADENTISAVGDFGRAVAWRAGKVEAVRLCGERVVKV